MRYIITGGPFVMLFLLLLVGCAPDITAPKVSVLSFCYTYQPVYWDASDTRKTKEQVDTNNRVWKKLCSKKSK
jgi:hypothetical protein